MIDPTNPLIQQIAATNERTIRKCWIALILSIVTLILTVVGLITTCYALIVIISFYVNQPKSHERNDASPALVIKTSSHLGVRVETVNSYSTPFGEGFSVAKGGAL